MDRQARCLARNKHNQRCKFRAGHLGRHKAFGIEFDA